VQGAVARATQRGDVTGTGAQNQHQGGLLGALPAAAWALGPIWLLPASGRCIMAEQKRIVLLLLLRLLLLRRLSERQNARGVLGLLRVGSPQSLLVDDAGRQRTSAAERGKCSGDLQWLLDVVAQLLRVVESREIRFTRKRNVLRSAARSSCRQVGHATGARAAGGVN
jgi:hypothetical protein